MAAVGLLIAHSMAVIGGESGLRQADLAAEIGLQGVVSEILNGKRAINARQAKALAARFSVSPAVFL